MERAAEDPQCEEELAEGKKIVGSKMCSLMRLSGSCPCPCREPGLDSQHLIILIWKRQIEGPETVPRLHREQIIKPELKLSHLTLEGLLLLF